MRNTHNPPSPRRVKTYSAESGYVFEYVFLTEPLSGSYAFDVSWDRRTFRAVSIQIDPGELQRAAGRELSNVERYAVAKIALRLAFDECAEPGDLTGRPLRPARERLSLILATLDLI